MRNHGGVPDIDPENFALEIGGLVKTPVKIPLKDLKDPNKFPWVSSVVVAPGYSLHCVKSQTTVTVTLQCSGTRRREQIDEYPGDGDERVCRPHH